MTKLRNGIVAVVTLATALSLIPVVQYLRQRVTLEQLYQAASTRNITIADTRDGAVIEVTANDYREPKTLRVDSYTPFQRLIAPGNRFYVTTQFVDHGANGLDLEDEICERQRVSETRTVDLCMDFGDINPFWQGV